jgi:hypothetical protein
LGEQVASTVVCYNRDLFGEPDERELLRKKGVVLHSHCNTGSTLVKDIAKVKQRRGEGHCIDCENCQQRELDWKYLIRTNYLDRNPHGELFIFILRRCLVILFDQILLAVR